MPAATRQRVLAYTSPDLRDLFFWERDTLSRVEYTNLVNDPKRAYGTAHPDTTKFPNHKLCYWEADPDFQMGRDGQDSLQVRKYYVADRADQDEYNFEFTAADIGGQKFNAVRRTYVIPREDWVEATPAMGAAMPRDPSDRFPVGYVLASRDQKRIGQKELDSLYIVEVRTYVEKVTIGTQKTDPTTGGSLSTSTTLYFRGESYDDGTNPAISIEAAAANGTYWGLTDSGVQVEVTQLSNDWWAVTEQDVIPQGLTPGSLGYLLRTYDTWENFTWPTVLGAGSLVFRSIARKNGSEATSVEVKPTKHHYSGPTRFTITQSWSKTAKTLPTPTTFDVKSGTYSGAQYNLRLSSVLTGDVNLTDTIGTGDPVFEPGVYGGSPWMTATTTTDWPAAGTGMLVDTKQQPFRGGYMITKRWAYPPY